MNSFDVIGYTLGGDTYCPGCISNPPECECTPEDLGMDELCQENCTGYGPNPIFVEGSDGKEVCGECGEYLQDVEEDERPDEDPVRVRFLPCRSEPLVRCSGCATKFSASAETIRCPGCGERGEDR